MTMLASFSLTLPLLHFFFLPLLPAMAAFILASFDFCTTLFAPMAPLAVALQSSATPVLLGQYDLTQYG